MGGDAWRQEDDTLNAVGGEPACRRQEDGCATAVPDQEHFTSWAGLVVGDHALCQPPAAALMVVLIADVFNEVAARPVSHGNAQRQARAGNGTLRARDDQTEIPGSRNNEDNPLIVNPKLLAARNPSGETPQAEQEEHAEYGANV